MAGLRAAASRRADSIAGARVRLGDSGLSFVTWLLLSALFCNVCIVALWLWGLSWIRRLWTKHAFLAQPAPEAEPDPRSPLLTVMIAAHNEELRIESCLQRLLAQNYGNLQIVVVNDRSTDQTSQRVRDVMARHERVKLLEVSDLPSGWIGKTHALAVAAEQVVSDYLLFIDCDCRLSPGAIAAVMRKVLDQGIEFASLVPSLDLRTPWEKLVTPPGCWLLGLWALLGLRRGDSAAQARLGNGQFMLFSRAAYSAVGGHASVPDELAEDWTLASKAAALGLKRWMGLGKGLYVTTRDNSFSQTANAWARVLIGSLVTPGRLLASTQLLLGGVVMPLWLLPAALIVALMTGSPLAWGFAVASLLHLVVMRSLVRHVFGSVLQQRPSLLSFTAGAAVCTAILFWALLVVSGWGQVRWGRTTYQVRGSRVVRVLAGAGAPISAS